MRPDHAISIAIEGDCPAADEADLRAVVERALAAEGVQEAVAIGVVLVDDETIHQLNRDYLNHDEPTDIVTFPLDGDDDFIAGPGGMRRELGEMYISFERAAAQSADWGSDQEREIRFLVVHGVLHLLGWDDATTEERERMLARQGEILAGWVPLRRVAR
ncbi:MAG: rRNA maturation RNase YbeY [Thermomicrobiales bacterium]